MCATSIIKFEVIVLVIYALTIKGHGMISYKLEGDYDEPRYAYDYAVSDIKTGDAKSQWETREGGIVKGEYSLVEPDGTVRTVEYTAHPHNGFNAIVKRVHPSGHQTLEHY